MIIVAEKPKVAKSIANFLSNGKYKTIKFSKNVYFYLFEKNNEKYYVCSALGHLYELYDGKREFPSFDYKWVPSYIANKSLKIKKKYIDLLNYIRKFDDKVAIATDFDIEGELIGYNIIRFILKPKKIYRMTFSAITKKDIERAFYTMKEGIYENFAIAGETRHILDWIYGINLSRAITYCIRKYDKNVTLSIGRVQGPTLKIVFEKENEIRNFKPEILYYPYVQIEKDSKKINLKHIKEKFKNIEEAEEKIKDIGNFLKVTRILRNVKEISPPHPYNLSDLQEDAYSLYRILPDQTLKIAQKLYELGYISYPRTSSQKLPLTINFREIIYSISKIKEYNKFCNFLLKLKKLIPNNGKKDDIHPAIHPTGILPKKLDKKSFIIYDLIVRRFLATFYIPSLIEYYKIFFGEFFFEYKRILKKGWLEIYWEFYKNDFEDFLFIKGEVVRVLKKGIKKKKSKGPERYNPSSLVKKLESLNLGTKSTRAEIIRILYKRKYIKGNKIKITSLGEKIIEIFEKYVPEILSVDLTRKIEKYLEKVEKGKIEYKDIAIEESKEIIKKVCAEIKENSEKIGKEIYECIKSLNKK